MATTKRSNRSDAENWLLASNPLRNLSRRDAENIADVARHGNEVRLQMVYEEIEKSFPILSMVVDRRSSALLERDWRIGTQDARRSRGYDEGLAVAQAEYLEGVFGEAQFNGLHDAIEHLSLAFFRGYSNVAYDMLDDGGVASFKTLDNVYFVREPRTDRLYWNPSASMIYTYNSPEVTLIPANENITVQVRHPVDYPVVHLYLMYSMGKLKYGQLMEKYGIPPVILEAPDTVTEEKMEAFAQRAIQIFEGGSGVVGYGTKVTMPSVTARGQDPFEPYLTWIDEQVVLLATGSTLGSLTGATGLGSGVAEVQEDTFDKIVARDGTRIAGAINKTITKDALDIGFPGKKHLAFFDFNFDSPAPASEVMDMAVKARAAGFTMDEDELSEKSGFALTKDVTPVPEPPRPYMNSEGDEPVADPPEAKQDTTLAKELELAFGAKFLPLADEFSHLAQLGGEAQIEQARRIIDIIDGMPELEDGDPMVAVIESALATYFADDINNLEGTDNE